MEEWRFIPGWLNYEVSSLGNVRRAFTCRGVPYGRPLKTWRNNRGYVATRLYRYDQQKTFYVHALVCAAFHGPRPHGQTVAHLNGNRADNRASNLQWKTYVDNHADKKRHGTEVLGEAHPSSKLTHMQVIDIHVRLQSGERQCDLAREYGMSRAAIQGIASGDKWKHITHIWRVSS